MTTHSSAPLIRVEHLTKTYAKAGFAERPLDRTTVIHDISFDIAHGETLGLVGPSGAGKTTLGRAILRLIEPTSGRVIVNLSAGDTVHLMDLDAGDLRGFRRHIQAVFQDPYTSLNPRMTVRQLIEEPLRVHKIVDLGAVRDRAGQLLDQVGLDVRLLDELPGRLSGGQRQRVSIARAIATEPSLLVADEPVTALDVSVQAQILNLLKDLRDQLGLSYLFVSHDLAVVEHMSDRIAVLSGGLLVEVGETAEILNCAKHPLTQTFVRAVRRSEAR